MDRAIKLRTPNFPQLQKPLQKQQKKLDVPPCHFRGNPSYIPPPSKQPPLFKRGNYRVNK